MLTNLQAYTQLAQINITVLTNLQTRTINRDRSRISSAYAFASHRQRSTFMSVDSQGGVPVPGQAGPQLCHLCRLWKRPPLCPQTLH